MASDAELIKEVARRGEEMERDEERVEHESGIYNLSSETRELRNACLLYTSLLAGRVWSSRWPRWLWYSSLRWRFARRRLWRMQRWLAIVAI